MSIQISTNIFSSRRHSRSNYRQNGNNRNKIQQRLDQNDKSDTELSCFKNLPLITPFSFGSRSVPYSCLNCQPSSREINDKYKDYGIKNCFLVNTWSNNEPFFIRCLPFFMHFYKQSNLAAEYKLVAVKDVINDKKLFEDLIFPNSKEEISSIKFKRLETIKKELERAENFIKQFGYYFGKRMLKIIMMMTGWVFGNIFYKTFDSISVHRAQLEIVQAVQKSTLPIIYIPLNISHLDPFVINWTLLNNGIKPPLFLASNSALQISIFGKLIKLIGGLGCTRIRKDTEIGYKFPSISAALKTYITRLIKNKNNLMIPMEPHRTRSGKPSNLFIGAEFLEIYNKLFKDKIIEDAIIIPISVSYEILPEQESLLQPGILANYKETFYNWYRFLFNQNIGRVRVNFAHPIRFQNQKLESNISNIEAEYFADNLIYFTLNGDIANWNNDAGSTASLSSVYQEINCFQKPEGTTLVDHLSFHSIYDATKSFAIMSTHLVSFIMLNKFPNGTLLENVKSEFSKLSSTLRGLNRELGFKFKEKDDKEILHAIKLLGKNLITFEKKNNFDFVKIVESQSSLVKLNYYASHVTSNFCLDSIITLALLTTVGNTYKIHHDLKKSVSFKYYDFEQNCKQLCNLMREEFMFHPPCIKTADAIKKAFDYLKDQCIISSEVKKSYNLTHDYEFEDYDYDNESSETVELSTSSETFENLQFLSNLIVPYIEIYGVMSKVLKKLLATNGEMDEGKFREELYLSASNHYARFKRCGKVITIDTIRNFISMLEDLSIIDKIMENRIIIKLNKDYMEERELDEFISLFFKFINF